jgi:hypothetical protein
VQDGLVAIDAITRVDQASIIGFITIWHLPRPPSQLVGVDQRFLLRSEIEYCFERLFGMGLLAFMP